VIPKVKICGVTSRDDALAACEAGADLLGLNFAPEAKPRGRYLDPDAAAALAGELPPFVTTVAITVNECPERLREYLAFLDYAQLSGDEPAETCAALEGRAIKAFRLGPGFAVDSMWTYPCRAYLLDAFVPGSHGGTGATCDWAMARRIVEAGRPVMLAGGLTPENVAEAVRTVRPYAVDVAGGVEGAPGKKDHEKLRNFIRNAKFALRD
jgi:phosphoribosylanthranilate isomerase